MSDDSGELTRKQSCSSSIEHSSGAEGSDREGELLTPRFERGAMALDSTPFPCLSHKRSLTTPHGLSTFFVSLYFQRVRPSNA
jgi:hypothetical protein